jgi:P27 family predicted phage terminase small subunit
MRQRTTTPKAPPGLSAEARSLWTRTLQEFTFETAADLALLGQLCESVDRLREIRASIKKTGLTVEGSNGQTRANPLLQSEDAARRTILAHVRALRLNSTPEL